LVDCERCRPVSFFDGRVPSWVEVRIFAIAPGGERIYDPAEWRNALVVIERGQVELQCLNGAQWRFARGDTLFLAGLPLRALRNDGQETALLCALSRAGDRDPPSERVDDPVGSTRRSSGMR
jgi:hypothetical protein